MSRTKTLGLHEWSKEDTIITLYFAKFGTFGLYLNTEKALADFIGTSVASFKMQVANIRTLLGRQESTLSDYSKLQDNVVSEYSNVTQLTLMNRVRSIINHDENELKEIFKKMGKDFSKMRKISR
jgi:hypothetical protein